eukprot:2450328-Pyramimonas_sp.AAC.1
MSLDNVVTADAVRQFSFRGIILLRQYGWAADGVQQSPGNLCPTLFDVETLLASAKLSVNTWTDGFITP